MDTPLSAIPVTYLSRILAVLMAITLVAPGSYAQGEPSATPVSEAPSELSGSISLVGWDGVTEIPFEVIDANGVLLESGTLSTDHYESKALVSTPATASTLSILTNSAFTENSVTTVADENGEFHFGVVLESLIDAGGSIQGRSSISESDQLESEVLYTISLTSSRTPKPLSGHLVIVTSMDGQEQSARADTAGNATFSLIPGSYDVHVEPYGNHAGIDLAVDVSVESSSVSVILPWIANSGNLTIRTNPPRDDLPMVRVINGDGVTIGEAQLQGSLGVKLNSLAFGDNYTVQVDGNEVYRQSTFESFNFQRSDTVVVPVEKRSWGQIYFFLTPADGTQLPDTVEVTLSNGEWTGSAFATSNGTDTWVGGVKLEVGEVSYSLHLIGYEPIVGSASVVSNNSTHVRLTMVPSPTPEPTPVPSPTPEPTAVPSPTPEPTAVPSPTPEPTPAPSPTPEPTAVPSPTPEPTAIPSPTPEPTAVPSPTPEPTAVPSPTPEPTAVPSPTPAPTAVPSPTPKPTAVPSPTPEPTAVPTPTPEPTAVPSPTPEPTVVPSPTSIVDDDGHIVTGITFQTRGSQRLEGSPYDLYAPIASEAEIRPYLSGIVGPGNRIELRDLPAGRYRLVIRPPGLLPVELLIDVGLADIEFVLPVEPTLSESVSIPTVAAVTESAPVRAVMSDEPSAIVGSDRVVITSLPSTGASSPSTTGIWKSGMMVALLMAVLSAGLAWKRTSEQ